MGLKGKRPEHTGMNTTLHVDAYKLLLKLKNLQSRSHIMCLAMQKTVTAPCLCVCACIQRD